MNEKILVTYASRTGSTADVAEIIGKSLSESGAQVDLIPMQEVKSISPYAAVVIGSPIRKSRWLPEAMNFIQDYQAELARKRVATFTVCITLVMSDSQQYRQAVAGWIAAARTQLNPVSEGLFAGRLDFTKLPFNLDTLKFRLAVALGIFPKDGRRDEKAVRVWSENLYPLLLQ